VDDGDDSGTAQLNPFSGNGAVASAERNSATPFFGRVDDTYIIYQPDF
jgi:hypothetical protein